MRVQSVPPTGVERFFDRDEIIVSKTDPKGIVTYANRVFLRVAGYTEAEIIGKPHSVIRHPAMPRCVFRLFWDELKAGREVFAHVVNQCKNGDHYWVLAHVTPTFDDAGQTIGYHSNRRVPERTAVRAVEELYRELRAEEARLGDNAAAVDASSRILAATLAEAGVSYHEYIFAL